MQIKCNEVASKSSSVMLLLKNDVKGCTCINAEWIYGLLVERGRNESKSSYLELKLRVCYRDFRVSFKDSFEDKGLFPPEFYGGSVRE